MCVYCEGPLRVLSPLATTSANAVPAIAAAVIAPTGPALSQPVSVPPSPASLIVIHSFFVVVIQALIHSFLRVVQALLLVSL